MKYTDSSITVKRSLRISRKFVSSRLAEELLGKASGYLISPGKHSVSRHSQERVERNVHKKLVPFLIPPSVAPHFVID